MADNITLPGSGAVVATDDDGAAQHQYVKIEYGADNTQTKVDKNSNPLPTQTTPRLIIGIAGTLTRPSNTTPYTSLDAVSNNATAGSVTALSVTLSDLNDAPIAIERIRIDSTDTGVQNRSFRIWLYSADPTSSTGIVGGDNATFSTKRGSFIGSMTGTFKTFSDGSIAVCTVEDGMRIITKPVSGAQTIYALLQTLSDFTPSANSTTFILTFEGFQGRV